MSNYEFLFDRVSGACNMMRVLIEYLRAENICHRLLTTYQLALESTKPAWRQVLGGATSVYFKEVTPDMYYYTQSPNLDNTHIPSPPCPQAGFLLDYAWAISLTSTRYGGQPAGEGGVR